MGEARSHLARLRPSFLLDLSLLALCGCVATTWDAGDAWDRTVRPALERYFLPAISVALLCNILAQIRGSLREVFCRRELPPSAGGGTSADVHLSRRTGATRELLPDLLAALAIQFRQIYAFQEFSSPQLYFHWFAKKGGISLFAIPWIKFGFLLLFVLGQASLSRAHPFPVEAATWWLLAVFVVFWVPGILVCVRFPYQKCWVTLADQAQVVYLKIARTSPLGRDECHCSLLMVAESTPARSNHADRVSASIHWK